ncbi:IlvD/Edd family dehydratase [Alteribacillus sp. HJP-4]|uniref:IlvD/Edd family dehydratase n=1 Tax=Alteribacillus sp. HJP-4 TaxID=2775394 RepID=UPI0035CCCE6D
MGNDEQRGKSFFSDPGFWGFIHRSFTKSMGYTNEDLQKPVIGICNTHSELNKCHANFNELADYVKRGVWQAGGLPLEFPTISLGEPYVKPTTMLLRNLAAMDTEEMIKAHQIDGVVLLGGCDKTIPAQLMAAASANVPSIVLTGGPMLNGRYDNADVGACTDCYRFHLEHKAGNISNDEIMEIEDAFCRSDGHCNVMGTASTMASIAEALGMTLPGCASIPAVDSRRKHIAEKTGKQIVEVVKKQLKPRDIMTKEAIENAICVTMASGGSTNAIIHLIAIAGRLGIALSLRTFEEISENTPFLLNLKPSGDYLMEEYFEAGGVPALLSVLKPLLHTNCLTVTGHTVSENINEAKVLRTDVITSLENPIEGRGGIAVLNGNISPRGALIKQTAVTDRLKKHRGAAVVFDSLDDMYARIDDEGLKVDENSVLILRNVGPKGAPGMPEVGQIPIPQKLLEKGVRDMVRISDGRISGTSYGTLIVHVTPEAAEGGPLAIIKDGDEIELDIVKKLLHLHLSDQEINQRLKEWKQPDYHYERGYGLLFERSVLQADQGCDFDFLIPKEVR